MFFDFEFQENKSDNKEGSYLFISLLSALFGAIIGGIITSIFIISIFGLNFMDVLSGKGINPPEILEKLLVPRNIEIITEYEDPGVAVAEKARPSVVNIRTERKRLIQNFFGAFSEKVEGSGSGVIIDEMGYILTNNHVVADADEIFVTLPSGEDVPGKVLGKDRETDIAIVKVERENLPTADIGTTKDLKVGEILIAIGNPYGFEHTVTFGVVSAMNRTITSYDGRGQSITLTDLIQTDAAINPGNSGGALCNKKGEVIGINTVIVSETGGSQGIGFAIPIDAAMDAAKQLIETGKVSHPNIGIFGTTLTKEIAEELDISVRKGAIISEAISGTPADKAGLQRGDIIIKLDENEIESMDDLLTEIRKMKVGDSVTITYIRDNEEQSVELILAERSEIIF
ncbi:MAG: trypsin-like peptidase domain-containing protein [Actinomycetia bacterium]|nr:trypsin-like peptidase domain-containing protein [Actinomycetes bacterium]